MLYRLSILFVLFISLSLFADSTERQLSEEELFLRKGYKHKHYLIAQELNLDWKNYRLYRSNNKKRVSGPIMTGFGIPFSVVGGIFIYQTASTPRPSSKDLTDSDFWYIFSYCTSLVMLSGGVTLTSFGVINIAKAQRRKVYRKDGTELSLKLSPIMNPINSNIGLQLSLNF